MQARIFRWGNSLGLRLLRILAQQAGIRAGQTIHIGVDVDRLIVQPVASRYRLEDLLGNVTPEAMRAAYDWGADVGRESLDS